MEQQVRQLSQCAAILLAAARKSKTGNKKMPSLFGAFRIPRENL
jgi:hypothetical protein